MSLERGKSRATISGNIEEMIASQWKCSDAIQ